MLAVGKHMQIVCVCVCIRARNLHEKSEFTSIMHIIRTALNNYDWFIKPLLLVTPCSIGAK